MKRFRHLLFIALLFVSFVVSAQTELQQKLELLSGIGNIEKLDSEHYSEKYLVRITQQLDPHNPEAGTFTQRVVVCHVGFDRPTVIVTEGYGGAYAQNPRYRDELSELFDANIVHVEHRYFLESTPEPLNWKYLTTENSAYDLHNVTTTFKQLYPGKWISTGISKGGQTTLLYRTWFPDDVDISVPYVAPLNCGVEDGRHEPFLRKVGTKAERKTIERFQMEILKRRAEIMPLLEAHVKEKEMKFRVGLDEVLDYCVLEYPFAFWQWGTSTSVIPAPGSDTQELFKHLLQISGPDYFSIQPYMESFFVQAAGEMGYYGYDTRPFGKLLSIKSSKGYLERIMLTETAKPLAFDRAAMYDKVYNYLKDNDPKMICIYGEVDPWSATRVPDFKGKENLQIYIQPRGSHVARIRTLPEEMQQKVKEQIRRWLEE
ncbi:aminopeptidase [Parabacteroides sp. OttesenSCG-928-G06]|nr:aminopeptidase [Parabacteroides sp. OttesenSCG-928-K15]MDL2282085.1 aminopeptidase [Parabacteroides sp. OttesenSCG-928-G06]